MISDEDAKNPAGYPISRLERNKGKALACGFKVWLTNRKFILLARSLFIDVEYAVASALDST